MDKTAMYEGVEVYDKPLGAHSKGRPHKMVKLANGTCMGYKKFEASFRKAKKAAKKAAKTSKKTPVAPVAPVETPADTTPAAPAQA